MSKYIYVDYNPKPGKFILSTARKLLQENSPISNYNGLLGEMAKIFMNREGKDQSYDLEISKSARQNMGEPQIRLLENLVELQNQRLVRRLQKARKWE